MTSFIPFFLDVGRPVVSYIEDLAVLPVYHLAYHRYQGSLEGSHKDSLLGASHQLHGGALRLPNKVTPKKYTTKEEGCIYRASQANYYGHCSAHRKNSCHPYLSRTLYSSHHLQILGMFCPLFSTATHHRGVSTYCLTYVLLCAIASISHSFCS